MSQSSLTDLIKKQFPDAELPESILDLAVGSIPDWDSLGHISLLLSIEEHYGIRFSLDEMEQLVSIKDITLSLESRGIEV